MTPDAPRIAIRAIAGGGDGVGTLDDGRTVFVPRTAPGDVIEPGRLRRYQRFARAEVKTLVEAGTGRVEPPCPHYIQDRCGGCQLMHLDPVAQRAAKARIVGDALRRIGHLDVADPEVVPATEQFSYRSRITLAWRGGRLGYHRLGDPDVVFEVQRCLLARPEVDALHQAVRAARRALPDALQRIGLRRDHEGGLHVLLESATETAWNGGEAFHAALRAAGIEATVWWSPPRGAARAVAGASEPWPATVFEQVNEAMGARVREAAVASLGRPDPGGDACAWDLYAGIGEATVALSQAGWAVESVELESRAVELAERIGPSGPVRRAGTVESHLPRLRPPEVVLTNPPRTGMGGAVTSAIAGSGARRVVYVSCDPATLARDLARLDSAYRVASVEAFDQFPQTSHVETIATLERR